MALPTHMSATNHSKLKLNHGLGETLWLWSFRGFVQGLPDCKINRFQTCLLLTFDIRLFPHSKIDLTRNLALLMHQQIMHNCLDALCSTIFIFVAQPPICSNTDLVTSLSQRINTTTMVHQESEPRFARVNATSSLVKLAAHPTYHYAQNDRLLVKLAILTTLAITNGITALTRRVSTQNVLF